LQALRGLRSELAIRANLHIYIYIYIYREREREREKERESLQYVAKKINKQWQHLNLLFFTCSWFWLSSVLNFVFLQSSVFFFFGPPLENITIAWYSVFTCISLGFFLSFLSFFLLKKKRNFCLYLYAYVFFSGNEDVWSLMLSCYFHVVIHNLLFILRWELPRSFFTPWWPWEDVFPLSRTW
jgi:hypothetical protein